MNNLITNIVSNTWYALLALLVLTVAFHFLFVHPRNLSKRQWKKSDYLWIPLTAIGLIGAINNSNLELSKNQMDMTSTSIPFQYKYLSSFLPPDGSPIVCREFIRDDFSPINLDSIVADYNRACEWSKKMYEIIYKIDTSKYQLIDTSRIPKLQTVDNKWFKGVILENINEYNKLVNERDEKQININNASHRDILFFTPLFLILGLAIRITKVTGEIKHEK